MTYDPSVHDYSVEKPSMHHVEGRHYVYLSDYGNGKIYKIKCDCQGGQEDEIRICT